MQAQALFDEHQDWAASIAKRVRRGLPPSFDLADLAQAALIQHWRCVESFDASLHVPYRAYAYPAIHGAVLMSCRRRNYREATHEELKESHPHVDRRQRPDESVLAREDWRNRLGPQLYRQRVKVRMALEMLPAEEAYVLRRVFLEGVEVESLAVTWGMDGKAFARLVGAAVRRLKREVINGTPAATAPRSRANAPEHRTPSHRSPAVLGWRPLRPPLRPSLQPQP
jgi:RNA polymerase sigma factor (sigma-70 family)